ncbi:MAG: helix-turn-helix transcriptional regulator [Eubacteriales bacterium]|nr:helix-turn-helix transcriptional regulator [Eubacteriales bacterium]
MEEHGEVMESERMTVALVENICSHLSRRNWSMKMLADRAELPYETVKKLIGGKIGRPSFISIWQIANALGCSIDSLTGRPDPMESALRQISVSTNEIVRTLSVLEYHQDKDEKKKKI